MVAERQRSEVNPSISALPDSYMPPPSYDEVKSNGFDYNFGAAATQRAMYFLAEVTLMFGHKNLLAFFAICSSTLGGEFIQMSKILQKLFIFQKPRIIVVCI